MLPLHPSRPLLALIFAAAFTISNPISAPAQSSAVASRPEPSSAQLAADAPVHGRLLLVLPFENRTGQQSLEWIGEAAPELFNQRLTSAGFLPISRADRVYALDHLGLPLNFQPSRASTLRLAQNLDADYVIVGSYRLTGTSIVATAQILDINALKLAPAIEQQADLGRLLDVLNSLAWRVARSLDPAYPVAQQTFVAADASLPVATFENYARGLIEATSAERVRHLKESVRLSPGFDPAWLALGKAYFADQEYELAADAFGRLPRNDADALQADFYRGLAFFYTGSYAKAEDAFAYVALRLPLPEVVNNQGVAASRHGKDAAPLFEQAIASDPRDPDYHFNLAISLRRRNDTAGAQREIDQSLKLHPQDSEAQSFASTLVADAQRTAAAPATRVNTAYNPANNDDHQPLERIKRNYNEASFRQAAFEMEQMQAMRLATMTPAARAEKLTTDGTQFLHRGLLLEAEREFQLALQADPNSATSHAGLAEVREHSADPDTARQEAAKSLGLQPNVAAHLVLARLDLQSNQLGAAASEVAAALKLEPANSAARGLRQALESRGQQLP